MAQLTHLDPQSAQNLLNDVHQKHAEANAAVRNIQDMQSDLLRIGWHGDSADKYRARSEQQTADLKLVSDKLQHVASQADSDVQQFIQAS